MNIEKLIEAAKLYGIDAADALAALLAENEKLQKMYQEEKAVCHATQAELEQVKVEREAAVECCRGYCDSCAFEKDCAKHDMNDAAPMRWYYGDCEDWVWRGPDKED